MSRILVVDDEPAIGWSLRELLTDQGHDVALAASAEEALEACERHAADCILLDVRLPGRDGIAAIPDLRSRVPAAPIVVMTAFGDLDTAVRAVQAGAFDYLVKPFDLDRVSAVVARAVADRAAVTEGSDGGIEADAGAPTLVGAAPAMQEVFARIAIVSATDFPVLVTGGPGTGKELAARVIHARSARRDEPFVATSLGALAAGAVDAELFGEVDRPGLLELAGRGTLLLDEVHAAPPAVQARLARLLETGAAARVGGVEPRPVAARIVAATDADLGRLVAAGGFRADLHDRLRASTLAMPALVARLDDVAALATHFLGRQAARMRIPRAPTLTAEFVAALRDRPWPGNVRELRQAVEFAAVVARGQPLGPEHLPPPATADTGAAVDAAVATAIREWSAAARRAFGGLPEPDLHHRLLKVVEAALLREALAHAGGNRTAAAKLLGLDRATLRTKLRLLGLDE
ncbi:MAG: sigma-54-dependent transcriptional regulator [Planctomycetaceae bacterium]